MSSKHRSGFTIVELLIVIVVIAILAALSIVAYTGIQQRATDAAIASKESQVKKKLEAYKVEYEAYPSSQAAFDTLIGQQTSDKHYTTYASTAPYSSYTISTTDGSTPALACASGFIPVPGNSTLGTSDFCVMKYEAKNVGGVATSQAASSPWVNISQTGAITTAQAACSGCHLITEAEWMTIAANVLSVSSNWSGGSVGAGYIYSGHNDNNPGAALVASTDDGDGYSGTGNTPPGNQRRTLTLTNGEVIWDFAGNIREWTSNTINGAQPSNGDAGYSMREYTAINNWGNLPGSSHPSTIGAGGWIGTNGIGRIYSSKDETGTRALIRGGYWSYGWAAGVLSLDLGNATSSMNPAIGFRVTK